MRRDGKHQPISVQQLALELPKRAWRTIKWREGTAEWLSSRFARARVRIAHRDYQFTQGRPEEWLLIEWPEGEDEPANTGSSTLAKDISFRRLIDIAKLRWRIERDYQELKQEFGLGHFEGRGWRGFHHHATLCIAAYEFLISERRDDSPCGPRSAPRCSRNLPYPTVTDPEAPPLRPERHIPNSIATMRRTADRRSRKDPVAMSLLQCSNRRTVVGAEIHDAVRLVNCSPLVKLGAYGTWGAKQGVRHGTD